MKKSTNIFAKVAILAVAALPMLTSCYDDTSIWDKFDEIEDRIESLELSLNEQLQALKTLIDGKTTVTSCEKNTDGSYKVTLSNGAKFTVLPDGTDYSALVSVITVNGVKCWATYDASGNLVAITDDAGQPVPVVVEIPETDNYKTQVEVVVEDGKYYLVIDGKKYMTGYDTEDLVQVFSSCKQLKDASGNVYAMEFTFGEGIKITVAVDGYNGVIFKLPNMINTQVVTEYYVAKEETQTLLIDMTGVVDYIMQIPDGWRVDERVDEYTGEVYIDITAPSEAAIAAGAAVDEGELKVVAVVEGGKAAVSKVRLSTDPFKTWDINGSKAVVVPYTGVQKFVYGIIEKNNYDEETLLNTVSQLLHTSGELPAGYAMSETAISAEHDKTYGNELSDNLEYVFWAIPALYKESGADAGFYVKSGMFKTYTFSNAKVRFTQIKPSLLDAEINVSFIGVNKVYAGTSVKTDDVYTEIVRLVNNDAYTPVEVSATYSGLASAFPTEAANSSVDFTYGTEYVSWVIPVQEGKTAYTVNDIISTTFKTKDITSGSTDKITFGTPQVSQSSISIPVSSAKAKMIFYVYMSKSDGERISRLDNDTKAGLILEHENCVSVKGNKATAVIEKLSSDTTMILYALCVDDNGKYGEVAMISATTAGLEFNSLTVTATEFDVTSDKASFKIEVTGGEASEFIYWFGQSNDDFWLNSKYLAENQTAASQYLALFPQDEHIVKAMGKYGKVTDGVLTVTDLTKTTEYILVISAKDAKGKYSKVGYKKIITLSANLGTIVREGSKEWEAAKAAINIEWDKSKFIKSEFYSYGFRYSGPTDLTAYILCASDEYFDHDSNTMDVESKIIEIEKNASKSTSESKTPEDRNGDYLLEPTWYDPAGKAHQGGMAVVADFYVHGSPTRGSFTYFAAGSHDTSCSHIEGGVCTTYQEVLKKINDKLTIDTYIDKFRGYYAMENNEECIEAAAQQLLDFYYPLYKDKKPILFENNGEPIDVYQHYGIGGDQNTGKIVDDVFVVLRDKKGNYYEPIKFEVPALWR